MADERPWMSMDVPDFVREAEEAMARGETLGGSYTEVTIKFGKGVWMKLPEDGTTRLSRSVKNGIDDAGQPIWGRETREVTNAELKALMESYKDRSRGSVLSDLSDRKEETAAAKPSWKAFRHQDAAR